MRTRGTLRERTPERLSGDETARQGLKFRANSRNQRVSPRRSSTTGYWPSMTGGLRSTSTVFRRRARRVRGLHGRGPLKHESASALSKPPQLRHHHDDRRSARKTVSVLGPSLALRKSKRDPTNANDLGGAASNDLLGACSQGQARNPLLRCRSWWPLPPAVPIKN